MIYSTIIPDIEGFLKKSHTRVKLKSEVSSFLQDTILLILATDAADLHISTLALLLTLNISS